MRRLRSKERRLGTASRQAPGGSGSGGDGWGDPQPGGIRDAARVVHQPRTDDGQHLRQPEGSCRCSCVLS